MLSRVVLVRTDVSEERQFLQEPHGITSQKMAFFIVTAVKTSNLTQPLDSIPEFYGIRRFITAFTRALHFYLS
jgi:hypothetical protein